MLGQNIVWAQIPGYPSLIDQEGDIMRFSAGDLKSTALFAVLYVVVVAVFWQLGTRAPITQVLAPFYLPIVAGLPFMLFLKRVSHFGMVTAMGLLAAVLLLVTGQPYWVLMLAMLFAPTADIIAASGHYKNWVCNLLGYVVFAIPIIGTVIPLFYSLDAVAIGKEQAWIDAMNMLTPGWMFVMVIALLIGGASIGGYVGHEIQAMIKPTPSRPWWGRTASVHQH